MLKEEQISKLLFCHQYIYYSIHSADFWWPQIFTTLCFNTIYIGLPKDFTIHVSQNYACKKFANHNIYNDKNVMKYDSIE